MSKLIKPNGAGINCQAENLALSSKGESRLDAKLARSEEQVRKGYFFEADSKLISDILSESRSLGSGKF